MTFKFLVSGLLMALLLSACEKDVVEHQLVLPEADSQGAVIFKKFCSACHAPPRISSHKSDEWLNIVERMQNHRIKKAYNPLTESEKSTLVSYLQKHSTK